MRDSLLIASPLTPTAFAALLLADETGRYFAVAAERLV